MLAAAFALSAGALFGVAVNIHRLGLDHLDGRAGALVGVATSTLVFWMLAPFYVQAEWWTADATLLFAACGLFMPALSTLLAIRAVSTVGPALTAALGSFTSFFAVLLAATFLAEPVGPKEYAGLALMTGGLILSAFARGPARVDWPLWALGLPLGAAFLRGASQPLAKVGLEQVPSAMFAALVMSSVSTALLLTTHVATRQGFSWRPRGALWFALAGVLNGFGIVALNAALGAGEVTVAAPLASTTPLWALLFGWLVLRREAITSRHLLVALMVFCGAALIVS